ncbi:hypothetical protein [Phormidesmis sp. 146-35]
MRNAIVLSQLCWESDRLSILIQPSFEIGDRSRTYKDDRLELMQAIVESLQNLSSQRC